LQGRVRNNQTNADKKKEEKCSSKQKKTTTQTKKKRENPLPFRYFDPLRSDDSVLIVDVFL
jgi:hypothetical protein